ncbi:hypothetical protein CUMW_251140 [Citrus unshiu]|uniref:Benzoate carboxyl methyltransferase n=1 Tax=Citrus unshiu TaxID=55188 RepID=A0A2H5QQ45_CITUN|nr:hypothetical protein CUMW_251140 [Citrus unshiu]
MVVVNVPCMNGGGGETSYAENSDVQIFILLLSQRTVILKAWPFLEETIKDMFSSSFPGCFNVADSGCSLGPNTLLVISKIIDTIHKLCHQANKKLPEFQVFLNDLPRNDFNSIFQSLPEFYKRIKKEKFGPCFVAGMPGSFYERLFPSRSINFIHSSYSVHWLSKVPENLENNKRNIYITKSSPPSVCQAFLEQFQRDFSAFLSLRSEEIVSGGRMFLTFLGRSIADPSSKDCCCLLELLVLLKRLTWIHSICLAIFPTKKKSSQFSGSKVNWDPSDDVNNKSFVFNKDRCGQNVANSIRAVTEPMLASHFGNAVIDPLFARFATLVAEHLAVEKTKYISIVISMTNK